MKFEWEILIYEREQGYFEGYCARRAKVPTGWILSSITSLKNNTEAMVFVPDPEHKWEIIK